MTLRWHKGMSLGEFEAMIAAHRIEEDRRRRNGIENCEHPFDVGGLEWHLQRRSASLLVSVGYRCTVCGTPAGLQTKRIKLNRLDEAPVEQRCR
jgi:hypothetical protein